jgi:hypothetical protein
VYFCLIFHLKIDHLMLLYMNIKNEGYIMFDFLLFKAIDFYCTLGQSSQSLTQMYVLTTYTNIMNYCSLKITTYRPVSNVTIQYVGESGSPLAENFSYAGSMPLLIYFVSIFINRFYWRH